ncbi:nucleotidyl transferase AbiEii/AbiGii toxin family protein [Candidatus Amarolinea dominans]|uniref:nucleotidyl transferase AbiEii/AbiGii toxin family protein n=1 Tax=Candidatus Amarolinea dominans TaxID=3140696 RepID=UPI001DFC095F|nr:nucleotidyl transferase AbiEii/AbiGii toxin family protein [Anaerolineae bacterium]
MKYATGADFRRALETRLRTLSQRDGAPLARLRKFIAFDRLLARLLYAEPEAWVLKGGLALQLRLGQRARTTKDMDVMWRLSAPDLHQLLANAASLDVNDWFRFVVERTQGEEDLLPGVGLVGAARNRPATLSSPPASWAQPLRRMADETALAWRDLDDAVRAAQKFVDPVLQHQNAGRWDPIPWTWEG